MSWLLRMTACRVGRHSRPERCWRKWDGGRCPMFCRHCWRVVGVWRSDGEGGWRAELFT